MRRQSFFSPSGSERRNSASYAWISWKRLGWLTLLIAMLLGTFAAPASAASPERKTVRVGWYLAEGLQNGTDAASVSGYNYEYLSKIAQYTNWDYEFVYGTWADLENMLIAGDIDLLGDVARTDARMKQYDFCNYPNGYSRMLLACRPEDDRFYYNDYSAFNGMTVATISSSFRISLLNREAERNGFTVHYREYKSEEEMFDALASGEADTAIFSNVTTVRNYKIISEWEPNPFYFVVNKQRSDLLSELNSAMAQIQSADIFMQERLFEKYFLSSDADINISLSRAEAEYIKQHNTIRVLVCRDELPYSLEADGSVSGIIPDYLALLSEKTGLRFEYILCDTFEDMIARFENGEGDVCPQLHDDFQFGKNLSAKLIQPYLKSSHGFVCRTEKLSSIQTVAYEAGDQTMQRKLKALGYELKAYPDSESCLSAVNHGDADAAAMDILSYEQHYYHISHEKLRYYAKPELDSGVCLGVSGTCSTHIFTALEKASGSISEASVEKIVSKNSAVPVRLTLQDYLLMNYPLLFALIVLLLITFAVLYFYRRQRLLSAKLQDAKLAADQANESKSAFLSSMSHDLRTPLNGIIGYTALARQEKDENRRNEYLDKVQSSEQLLLDLVNDTLELSRIESGKMELVPEVVYGKKLWETVITAVRPLAAEKGVHIAADTDTYPNETVYVDRNKVQKVVLNLLTNAVKYTPAGGTVTFAVGVLEPPRNGCTRRITVQDTGIGMAPEFMARLYEPFAQEHRAEAAGIPGTGLGLSIVKRVVDLMGGTISVESEVGKGTRFTVDLPVQLRDAACEDTQPEKSNEGKLGGIRILLCEDNIINTEIATLILKGQGVLVDSVPDGQAGVRQFLGSPPGTYQAILMDIRMPVLDGYGAAQEIRRSAHPDAQKIPIIAMTADAFDEDIRRAIDAGMNAHIAKPIDPVLFRKALEEAIQRDSSLTAQ